MNSEQEMRPMQGGGSEQQWKGAAFSTAGSSTFLYVNTECDGILISDDKLKLKLIKFRQNRQAKFAWVAPFGIVLTLSLTLSTSQFRDTFGLSPDTLKGVTITALIASVIWLIATIIQLIRYLWRYKNLSDIDAFIEEIKKEVTAQRLHKPSDVVAKLRSPGSS